MVARSPENLDSRTICLLVFDLLLTFGGISAKYYPARKVFFFFRAIHPEINFRIYQGSLRRIISKPGMLWIMIMRTSQSCCLHPCRQAIFDGLPGTNTLEIRWDKGVGCQHRLCRLTRDKSGQITSKSNNSRIGKRFPILINHYLPKWGRDIICQAT